MRFARSLTVAGATALLLGVGVLPAGAHPYFVDGATAPAGSLTTLTLDLAHGCGTEADAAGSATTEVLLEVPEAFSYVEPGEVDGYEAVLEGDGAIPEAVLWQATDGGVPAPQLPIDVVVEGDPGDELYVRVVQRCGEAEHRWVGTPDDPADDPAVGLTLTEHDPEAPAPPEPTVTEPDATTDEPDEVDEVPADDEVVADDAQDATDDQAATVEELPSEPPADEDGGANWLPILIGAVVLAGIGASLIAARRRPVADPTALDDDRTPEA